MAFCRDLIGRRPLLMMFSSASLVPAFLLMGYTDVSLVVPVALPRVGVRADDALPAARGCGRAVARRPHGGDGIRPANPEGYSGMILILTGLTSLGLIFALLLWRTERGPHAHGLETITTRASALPHTPPS